MAESKSYTSRDVVSIRQDLVNRVPTLTKKWRDFSESDLGMILIELMAGSQDMQNYYFDTQTFETYIDTAQQEKNVRSLCRTMNYRIPLVGAAKGIVSIKFTEAVNIDSLLSIGDSGDDIEDNTEYNDLLDSLGVSDLEELQVERYVEIPKYTQFTSSNGSLVFCSIEDYSNTIYDGTAYVQVIEGTPTEVRFKKSKLASNLLPSGEVSRRLYLGYENVADGSVEIYQDGEIWEECDDALLKYEGGRYFSVHKDSFGQVYVFMSPDFLDLLPEDEDEEISVRFIVCNGLDGNIPEGYLDGIISSNVNLSDIAYITNEYAISGGYNEPDIQRMKINAMLSVKHMDRFITLEDYAEGVQSLPYVMRSICFDWKNSNYCNDPFVVLVYAVGWDGEELPAVQKNDMIQYLESKGVTDVEVRAPLVDIVEFGIDIEIDVTITNSREKELLVEEIQSYIRERYDTKAITFGDSIQIAKIAIELRTLSPKIKAVRVLSPSDDIIVDYNQYPRLDDISVTLVEI